MPREDLGWLRVIGIGVVFLIHAAQPFNPWDTWHIVNADRSRVLGEVALLGAPWAMPLFMFVAGAGSWYSLARRAPGAFLWRRVHRIGVPLLVGLVVLVPPQVWLERRAQGRFDGSLLEFYPHVLEGWYPRGNFAFHHLWFLAFLIVVNAVALPVLQRWRAPATRASMMGWCTRLEGPWGLAWLFAPVVALRLLVWWGFGESRFISWDWSSRVLLLPAFLFGAAAAAFPGVQRAIDHHWRAAATIAAASSVALVLWSWPGDLLARLPAPRTANGALVWSAYTIAAWSWVIALAGMAFRYLRRADEVAHTLAEGVYPFYLLHQPLIVAYAAAVVGWDAPVSTKWLAIAAAALATTVLFSWAMVRAGPLRRLVGLESRAARARRMTLA